VVKLESPEGIVVPEELYFEKSLSPSIGGAVLWEGHLYGAAGDVLFCADFETGEIRWRHRSVGASSVCYADGRLYVRGYNSGEVALVEPSPVEYREKGRFMQNERSNTKCWPHPVVANGGLYLRDQNSLLCYEVSQSASD
jgi:outer membrane protein assembly factor BamB